MRESSVSSERDRKCPIVHSKELDTIFIKEDSREVLFLMWHLSRA